MTGVPVICDLRPHVTPVLALAPVFRHGRNLTNILGRNRCAKIYPPQGNVGERVVGIEGVHAVVLGSHEEHVASPSANVKIRNVQRLGVYVLVHCAKEQSAKVAHVDIGSIQHSFIEVLSSAPVIVVLGEDRYLGGAILGDAT